MNLLNMSLDTLSWCEFLAEAQEFQRLTERLGDCDWCLCKKNDEEYNSYLVYKQKIRNCIDCEGEDMSQLTADATVLDKGITDILVAATNANELLQIEYHIVYSVSYEVPVLYFRIYRNDGRMVDLADAWRLFRCYDGNNLNENIVGNRSDADMLSILTQMEHPILQKPYLALHPCRTAELLAQAGASRNRVLTFISVVGPYVQLNLRNEYGLEFACTRERKVSFD